MKTTFATALSLIGVLAAGSAAALVNTTIFDAAPSDAAASAAVLPAGATVDLTIPTPLAVSSGVPVEPAAPSPSSTTVSSVAPVRDALPVVVASASLDASPLPRATNPPPPTAAPPAPVSSSLPPATIAPAPAPAPTSTLPAPSASLTTFNLGAVGSVTLDVVAGRLVVVDVDTASGWQLVSATADVLSGEIEVLFASADTEVAFLAALSGAEIATDITSRLIDTGTSGGFDDDDHDDYDDHDDHDDYDEGEDDHDDDRDDEHDYEDDDEHDDEDDD